MSLSMELMHYNAENYILHSVSSRLFYVLFDLIVSMNGTFNLFGKYVKQRFSLYIGRCDNNKSKPKSLNVISHLAMY